MALFGSVAEYARHRRCTTNAVYMAVKDGKMRRLKNGKINFIEADITWPNHKGQVVAEETPETVREVVAQTLRDLQPADDGGKETITSVTLRLKRAQAELAEAKARRQSGDLLETKDVERGARLVVRKMGAALENGPTQWAVLVAGKTDLGDIEDVLRAEINKLRERFADDMAMLSKTKEEGEWREPEEDVQEETEE